MKTYEGIMTIKWYKNDSGGDRRPLTIDVHNSKELTAKLNKIKCDFMTLGDNQTLPDNIKKGKPGELPYSVSFDMKLRQ